MHAARHAVLRPSFLARVVPPSSSSSSSQPRARAMSSSSSSGRARTLAAGSARASLSPEVRSRVVTSITGSIKFGAPMFNAGDAAGCVKLYRQTAMGIVRDVDVDSDAVKSTLRDAVARADGIATEGGETDAAMRSAAWALRRGLDAVVNILLDPPPDEPIVYSAASGATTGNAGNEEDALEGPGGVQRGAASAPSEVEDPCPAIFDFAANPDAASRWRSMNDGVMGGVSDGMMLPRADLGCARFTGCVRTENNGGFASVRASMGSGVDMSAFSGLYVDARAGDAESAGKRYLLVVKDDEAMTTQVNLKSAFAIKADEFGRVKVPFTAFDRPERMGRAVMRGALRAEAMCEIGLMVLKGDPEQLGTFNVDVRAIGAYK